MLPLETRNPTALGSETCKIDKAQYKDFKTAIMKRFSRILKKIQISPFIKIQTVE